MSKAQHSVQDRTINTTTVVPGALREEIHRNGALLGRNNVPGVAQKLILQRSPSGGKELPHREKPFLYGRLEYEAPYGFTSQQLSAADVLKHEGHWVSAVGFGSDTFWSEGVFPNTLYSQYPPMRSAYPPPINPDLLSQAEVKALNGLAQKTEEVDLDLGLFYAERRETYELFRMGAVGLWNLMQALRKADAASAKRVLMGTFRLGKPKNEHQWGSGIAWSTGDETARRAGIVNRTYVELGNFSIAT